MVTVRIFDWLHNIDIITTVKTDN